MDTLTPTPPEQVASFRAALEPAAKSVCAAFGMDPIACVAEALVTSGCGRFSVAFNYWNLPGTGNAGSYLAVVALKTGEADNGGYRALVDQRAKFATARDGVAAWCQARR